MTVLAAHATGVTSRYSLRITNDEADILAAQRLRHQTFTDAFATMPDSAEAGRDADEFDDLCDHLVVIDEQTSATVGTYRLLPPERAELAGRLYSEAEFDLRGLDPLRSAMVEVGRSCVHPQHRNGAVIGLMWTGLARYLHLHDYRWLGGCVSVSVADGGSTIAGVWQKVANGHLAPPPLRVTPHRPWSLGVPGPDPVSMPPLLQGYLRLGAWVCGAPAYDPDFEVADLFVLLPMDRIDPRYLRHFLGEAQEQRHSLGEAQERRHSLGEAPARRHRPGRPR